MLNPFLVTRCSFLVFFTRHSLSLTATIAIEKPETKNEKPVHLISLNRARNFCVARNNVFLAVSSVVFSISPMVRSFNPW